jgi:hypothetical protein
VEDDDEEDEGRHYGQEDDVIYKKAHQEHDDHGVQPALKKQSIVPEIGSDLIIEVANIIQEFRRGTKLRDQKENLQFVTR